MAGPRLSIDFGTTNTAAAWVDPQGQIHEIRLSHTSTLMPSAVFAERGPTGAGVVVGSAAINLSATAPDAFEPNPKRRLRESDIILGGHRFDTTELVAAVLRSVIGTATTVAGTPFRQVTLTHPDGWAGHLQNRLRDAAIAAGLDRQRIRLITEAQAAAHYYSAHRDRACRACPIQAAYSTSAPAPAMWRSWTAPPPATPSPHPTDWTTSAAQTSTAASSTGPCDTSANTPTT